MTHTLLVQDCIDLQPELFVGAKLVYLDPPYGPEGEDTYFGVGKTPEEYLTYVLDRVKVFKGLTDYNLVLHVDWKYSHYFKVRLDEMLGRENFRNEIVWCYSGPSVAKRHFPRKHDVLLWYGMGNYPYNPSYVPYHSSLKVGGGKAWSKTPKNEATYLARGKPVEDWWTDIPALVRNEKEKRQYPTQKPQALLDRIVLSLSNSGDLVVDPMMGSGTTLMSCLTHTRKFVGCDISQDAVDTAEKWVEENLGLTSWYT